PLIHQVAELPKIEPIVDEYRLHRLSCPDCGETTCGTLPEGVPTVRFGPYLAGRLGHHGRGLSAEQAADSATGRRRVRPIDLHRDTPQGGPAVGRRLGAPLSGMARLGPRGRGGQYR